jgi:hypothetical protein
MPTGTAENDRVIVVSCMGRNRTQGYTWNDSFTSMTSGAPGGTIFITAGNDMEIAAAYRDMPASPPASITATPNVTKGFVSWAGRCPAGTFDPATAPIIVWSLTSSDAPSLDPPWGEDTLFISALAAEEFDFSTHPLPDNQFMRNSGQLAGAICSTGQVGGAALDLGPWAAFFDTVNGTLLIAVKGAASGPDLAQLQETESITVLSPRKSKAAAQLAETSTITALTVRKVQVLAQLGATEELVDFAGAIKTKPLGDQLVEASQLLPIGVTQILGQILEPSELLPMAGGVKTKPLAQLTATEALQALTGAKALPLVQLVESGALGALSLQSYLGQLVETSQLGLLLGGTPLAADAKASSSGFQMPVTVSGLYCLWCSSPGLLADNEISSRGLVIGASSSGLQQTNQTTGLEA